MSVRQADAFCTFFALALRGAAERCLARTRSVGGPLDSVAFRLIDGSVCALSSPPAFLKSSPAGLANRGRSLNPDIANTPRPKMFQTAKYLAWISFFAIASAPSYFQGAGRRSARPVPSWQSHRACDDPVPSRVLPQICLLRCKRRYRVGGGSYLVNLICTSLGECFAYNFSTRRGSEHTCPS